MIVTNAEEFVKHFGPGDVVYYTTSFCSKPGSIESFTLDSFTHDGRLPQVRHYRERYSWERDDSQLLVTRYINDFFYANKLVATTQSDAELALSLLKARFKGDPDQLAEYIDRYDALRSYTRTSLTDLLPCSSEACWPTHRHVIVSFS